MNQQNARQKRASIRRARKVFILMHCDTSSGGSSVVIDLLITKVAGASHE